MSNIDLSYNSIMLLYYIYIFLTPIRNKINSILTETAMRISYEKLNCDVNSYLQFSYSFCNFKCINITKKIYVHRFLLYVHLHVYTKKSLIARKSLYVFCSYVQVEVGSIKLNAGRIHYPTSDTVNHESVLYGVIGCLVVTSILCVILVIFVMRRSMNTKMDKALTDLKQMKDEMSRIVAREGSLIVLSYIV